MARRAWLLLLPLAACGPSVSAVYESNIRFEHCYRLDLDVKVAPGHRGACWKEWSQRYTYGQTRDRLEYARRRIAALDAGDASRPQLDLSVTDGGVGTTEAPAPTNLHAPPPPTLATATGAHRDGGAPDASVMAITPDAGRSDPPGSKCVADCRQSWRDCGRDCDPDAGKKRGSCKACDTDYGRCVQRCYK
ncbi:MAG: hypothetical protein L6Q84_32450 [Polyangiaceae bacterium]|nr:hypothetical protein [Polyangiaceae bacterium]